MDAESGLHVEVHSLSFCPHPMHILYLFQDLTNWNEPDGLLFVGIFYMSDETRPLFVGTSLSVARLHVPD